MIPVEYLWLSLILVFAVVGTARGIAKELGVTTMLLLTGVAGLGFALVQHVRWAIELYAWSHWGSLALLGGAVIVSASLLERHHDVVIRHVSGLRRRFATWEA